MKAAASKQAEQRDARKCVERYPDGQMDALLCSVLDRRTWSKVPALCCCGRLADREKRNRRGLVFGVA